MSKVLAEEKESVSRIKTILDSMVEGVAVADTDMHFTLFNKSAERILGLGLSQEDPSKYISPANKGERFLENLSCG